MAEVKFHKVVASLPPEAELVANSIYYVRVGSGFDQYVTNSLGTVVAYKSNVSLSLLNLEGRVENLENSTGQSGSIRVYNSAGGREWLPLIGNMEVLIILTDGESSSLPTLGVLYG